MADEEVVEETGTPPDEGGAPTDDTGKSGTGDDDVPKGVKKKLDKMTYQLRSTEEALAVTQRELATLKSNPPANTATPPAATGINRLDFETDEEYHKALMDNAVKTAKEELKRDADQEKAVAEARNLRKQYDEAAEKYDDFHEVALSNTLQVTAEMFNAAKGKNLTDILYYLGKNPNVASRISSLSPVEQIKEIGKIESNLTTPPKKKTTNAPEPPKTVSGAGDTSSPATEQELLEAGNRAALHKKWHERRLKAAGIG